MATPTQARVCEYFNYDPETGLLTFKERPRSEFSLGQFKTLHEARIARKAAERVLGFTGSDRDGYAVRKVEAMRGAA
ncbi:hypothetical protein G6M04_14490 [Agrobacterium rhizogenes]|uniref:hypothetical protein n=1 Tax=Rhizobium rhizogenes TaxID=359 RepID=UPI0015736311|nr:hypothetical protein [Rhizobium rhizogenes]NTG48598.1 hypothetical protein [Rhizobium rhizogenes]